MGLKRTCDRCQQIYENNTFYRITIVVTKFRQETGHVHLDYYNEHTKHDTEIELCRQCYKLYENSIVDFNLL